MPPALAREVIATDALAACEGEKIATAEDAIRVLHPSGDPTPSIQDRELTAALVSLGDQLGVKVLDHLILV